MKKVFILSALGLSLLASANVMAANNFPRDSRFSGTTGGEKFCLKAMTVTEHPTIRSGISMNLSINRKIMKGS